MAQLRVSLTAMNTTTNLNLSMLQGQFQRTRHEAALGDALQRMSTGSRLESAAEDPTNISSSNLFTTQSRALDQINEGLQNGISYMQSAEGGLQSINELLQRANELAVQAGNGTLTADELGYLDEDYQGVLKEIDRIASTTEVFRQFPLASIAPAVIGNTESITSVIPSSGETYQGPSGVVPMAFIPEGAENVFLDLDSYGADDDIQIFTQEGKHIVGTPAQGPDADYVWRINNIDSGADVEDQLLTEANGFDADAVYDDSDLLFERENYNPDGTAVYLDYNGMDIGYSGDGDQSPFDDTGQEGNVGQGARREIVTINQVTEPLFIAVVGQGSFEISATWDLMPGEAGTAAQSEGRTIVTRADFDSERQAVTIPPAPSDHVTLGLQNTALDTPDRALETMDALSDAFDAISGYRSEYAALTNRLSTTYDNHESESVITKSTNSNLKDTDFAKETANVARLQLLLQATDATLTQSQQVPDIVLALLR